MRILYLLGGCIFMGALLMLISSYKVFSALQGAGATQLNKQTIHMIAPGMQPYVFCGYAGIALFSIGSIGAILVLLASVNRRF